jgi:hypothetical protein
VLPFYHRDAGSDISQRVVWSHQLTKEEAAEFTLEKILSPYIISESPAEQWIKGKD